MQVSKRRRANMQLGERTNRERRCAFTLGQTDVSVQVECWEGEEGVVKRVEWGLREEGAQLINLLGGGKER